MLVEGTVITGELPKMRAKSILIQGEIAGTPWRACLLQRAFFKNTGRSRQLAARRAADPIVRPRGLAASAFP